MPVILFSSKQFVVAVHGDWSGVFMGKYSCFYDEQYIFMASPIKETPCANLMSTHEYKLPGQIDGDKYVPSWDEETCMPVLL